MARGLRGRRQMPGPGPARGAVRGRLRAGACVPAPERGRPQEARRDHRGPFSPGPVMINHGLSPDSLRRLSALHTQTAPEPFFICDFCSPCLAHAPSLPTHRTPARYHLSLTMRPGAAIQSGPREEGGRGLQRPGAPRGPGPWRLRSPRAWLPPDGRCGCQCRPVAGKGVGGLRAPRPAWAVGDREGRVGPGAGSAIRPGGLGQQTPRAHRGPFAGESRRLGADHPQGGQRPDSRRACLQPLGPVSTGRRRLGVVDTLSFGCGAAAL